MSRLRGCFARSKARQGDSHRHQIPAPCPHSSPPPPTGCTLIGALLEDTLHVDKIHVRFKIANITHALPVPVYPQTGTTTGVNSRRGDSRRHDILWWYHVNKCRAMRGNRSELTPERKSPPVSCKHPLTWYLSEEHQFGGRKPTGTSVIELAAKVRIHHSRNS